MTTDSVVLIADDNPENLRVLSGLLKEEGYHVRVATNGEGVLKSVQASVPDLILLDIHMPGMDGYETCSRLKAEPAVYEIPVIFVSALNASFNKVRAFELGGVDYISKPFDLPEVSARVRTHLEMLNLRREARKRVQDLKRLERLREDLTQMFVHDLMNPLHALLIQLEMADEALSDNPEQARARILQAGGCARETVWMVENLLFVARLEDGEMPLNRVDIELDAAVDRVVSDVSWGREGRDIRVVHRLPRRHIQADKTLLDRVIVNLLANALRYGGDGEIRVEVSADDERAIVRVSDDGPGVDPKYHDLIFEKFASAHKVNDPSFPSTGLGLAFCKLAVEAHGGKIGVDSRSGRGSTFWFDIPINGEADSHAAA